MLCGLQGPAWHLRPNFQSNRTEVEALFGDAASDADGVADDDPEVYEDSFSRYPEPPDYAQPGLLS